MKGQELIDESDGLMNKVISWDASRLKVKKKIQTNILFYYFNNLSLSVRNTPKTCVGWKNLAGNIDTDRLIIHAHGCLLK